MHFPKHWKLARKGGVCAWGWSDDSEEAALTDGERRVDRIRAWIQEGFKGERNRYGYPDRPMREEVLREFKNPDGSVSAVLSRNSYGCEVLNTNRALFVDVDESQPGLLSSIGKLFGKGKKSFEESTLQKINEWLKTRPEWGWRAYRTKAGIRLLATHSPVAPEHSDSQDAFTFFDADLLYRKLCQNQKCFRARLTPKPWRCGIQRASVRWPWKDDAAKNRFKEWNEQYRKASEPMATCKLLGHYGRTSIHMDLKDLVDFHDQTTRADSGLPLG